MRDISRDGSFDAAICMGNSFGYLDLDGLREFVAALAAALRPGGGLVVDFSAAAESVLPGFADDQPRDMTGGDITVAASSTYDVAGSRLLSSYVFTRGTQEVKLTAVHHVYTVAHLRQLLVDGGFTDIEHCGGPDGKPFEVGTGRLLLTARRASSYPTDSLAVAGTILRVEQRGDGPPLLLVHGGGEDATMLSGQADALAAAGYRVISYDRRGTGGSGDDAWPGNGADQHADDAAALLTALDATPATVLGVSSGGVVALALAARHPDAVRRVVAWEPPASGVLPDAAATTAAIMAPVQAHLREHPGDYAGAQAIALTAILGFPVAADDPAFAAARVNAEPMIRDEPTITLRPFTSAELTAVPVTIAVGGEPNDVVGAAVARLGELSGRAPVVLDGADHEVYLADPSVLTALVGPPGETR